MTEQQKNKRTRRRFLADMLFLGGGVTAAALIARSQLGSQPVEPQVAGDMEVPIADATPCPAPTQTPDCPPPMPGEPVMVPPPVEDPNIAGEVMMPPPENTPAVKGDVAAPPPPKTGGKPIAPKPNRDQP